jgi:hypothetical protein
VPSPRAASRPARARARRARARRAAAAERAAKREEAREQAAEEKAAEEEAAEACHPSYDACLDPNSSDYDCQDGSGDGPNYTGPVTVTGPDDYGLDSDGDGYACES